MKIVLNCLILVIIIAVHVFTLPVESTLSDYWQYFKKPSVENNSEAFEKIMASVIAIEQNPEKVLVSLIITYFSSDFYLDTFSYA